METPRILFQRTTSVFHEESPRFFSKYLYGIFFCCCCFTCRPFCLQRKSSEAHNHLIFCWFGCSSLSHGASLELHECSSLQCDKFCIDFIVHRDLQQCLNWNIVIGRICSHSSGDLFYYLNIRRTGIYILCCTSAINDFSTVTESPLLDLIVLLRISGKEVIDFFCHNKSFNDKICTFIMVLEWWDEWKFAYE